MVRLVQMPWKVPEHPGKILQTPPSRSNQLLGEHEPAEGLAVCSTARLYVLAQHCITSSCFTQVQTEAYSSEDDTRPQNLSQNQIGINSRSASRESLFRVTYSGNIHVSITISTSGSMILVLVLSPDMSYLCQSF